MDTKPPFTESELYRAARNIRHQKVLVNPKPGTLRKPEWDQILNNCWYVNRDIRDHIIYHNTDITSIQTCVSNWNNELTVYHYIDVIWCTVTDWEQEHSQDHAILVIDSQLVCDDLSTNGYVIVDGALDQFNDDNYENNDVPFTLGDKITDVPSIIISPPGSTRREQIYHEIESSSSSQSGFSPQLPV